ncbi:MAG TPA: sialidase family protein [Polyangiales bacterium]
MSRIRSALFLAAIASCAFGCSGDDSDSDVDGVLPGVDAAGPGNPPDTGLPTGPPPSMFDGGTWGPMDAGGATTDTGTATVPDAARPDSAVPTSDAGVMPGTDAGFMPPDPGGPVNMAPAKFGPNVRVNTTTRGQQTEVVMAAHPSGLVLAAWMDGSGRRCAFSVSKDGGATWGPELGATTQASSGSAFAGDPAAAIDEKGNLFAVCQDYASGGLGTNYVLLAHSKDQGATWSGFKRVNQSLDKPWVGATGDGTVLLTWLGNPGGVKRSTDFGATWSTPTSLGYINHGTTMSISPSGPTHMAYNTGETTVTYRRSMDKGMTWEPARNLSPQGQPCRSPCSPRSHPIVGAGADPTGQVVAVTWASRLTHADAQGDDDVWVIVSYDAGKTFSMPKRVNDNMTASRQFQSWAAVDSYGGVHVVWTDLRNGGNNDTYYARMTDMAKGFEPNVKVNDGTGRPSSFLGDYKGIEIQGRDVLVIWTDSRANDGGDIYFARAKDAAAAGGPLMR